MIHQTRLGNDKHIVAYLLLEMLPGLEMRRCELTLCSMRMSFAYQQVAVKMKPALAMPRAPATPRNFFCVKKRYGACRGFDRGSELLFKNLVQ